MLKILTFLGTSEYCESTVCIKDFKKKHRIFPVVLAEYYRRTCPEKRLKMIFFLTAESKNHKNWKEYTEPYLKSSNICYEVEEISAEDTETLTAKQMMELIMELIKKMLKFVDKEDKIVLDTTHSFRSISITAVVISLYLKEATNTDVEIFYGMYNADEKTTKCVDLTPIMKIAEWLHAARVFKEYGYSNFLGELVKERNNSCYKDTENNSSKPKKLSSFQKSLQDLSTALRLGSIRSIREKLREFVSFFDSVDNKVMKEIEEFVPELYPLMQAMCKRYKKLDTGRRKIELDDKELKAEQELLKFYLETEDLGMALRLAREYMVNVKLYKEGRVEDVLNRGSRENVLLPEQGVIREARNHVAHFGFNENDFPSQEKLKKDLKEIVDMSPDELFEKYEKRKSSSVQAVLSPLGTSKGALFTVLKHFNPRVLVVMTSKLGAKNLPEILQKAGFSGEHQVILVNDPFTGVDEVDKVVTEAEKCLQDIQKVVINLTGGTSLLGYMVERVRDRVRYGRQIDSVLAVDRRSYKEQEKNPYVVGEILKLPGM